jgi:site-specific DNA recombinase
MLYHTIKEATFMTVKETLKLNNVTEIVAYSRKSRGDEDDLTKHRDDLLAYGKELGIPITVIEEIGSSETLERESLKQIRERITRKEIRCLAVLRLDRLTRKTTDLERLLKEFQFHDVILLEVGRKKIIDYNDAIATKLESIMSDLYQEQAKIVLNEGKRRGVKLYGRQQGGTPPLGYIYNRNTGKLDIDEKTAHIVRYIFEQYTNGVGSQAICKELNQQGYRTANGNLFKPKAIADILRNHKYLGMQVHGRKKWFKDTDGRVMSRPAPEKEWVVFEDAHEALVDEETFQKAQKTLEENTLVKATRRKLRTYSLTKLVKCAKCGNYHTFYTRKDRTTEKPYMKPCHNRDYITGEKCGNSATLVETVEDFAKDKIWNEVRPAFHAMNRKISKDKNALTNSADASKLKELYKMKRKYERMLDNILDMQIMRGADERLYAKEKEVNKLLNNVTQEIEDMENNSVDTTDWVSVFMKLNEPLDSFLYNFMNGDASTRNKLLSKYIDHITYRAEPFSLEVEYTEEVKHIMALNS